MLPVVLSFGLGLDGSIILGRWCTEPDTREFCLERDLIVVTAQTGGESAETQRQMEQYLLPLMREHNIRFIQLARGYGNDS